MVARKEGRKFYPGIVTRDAFKYVKYDSSKKENDSRIQYILVNFFNQSLYGWKSIQSYFKRNKIIAHRVFPPVSKLPLHTNDNDFSSKNNNIFVQHTSHASLKNR